MKNKSCLKVISVLVVISLLFATVSVSFASAQTTDSPTSADALSLQYGDCVDGSCEYYPTIIVPGIFQCDTYLLDDEGNRVKDEDGEDIEGWPLSVDTMEVVKGLALPLLRMLITQKDNGFSDAAAKVVSDVFSINQNGPDGKLINNVAAEKYDTNIGACSEEIQRKVLNTIPVGGYSDVAGLDHLYFLSYNSFGNNHDIADELYELIQTAKRETGHDKVNLVAVSLGGTIANMLLECHPDVVDDLYKVVYIIPALDGSVIISDLFKGKLSTENEMLYRDLIPSLMGEDDYTAYLINIALRIMPKSVLKATLDKVLSSLQQAMLVNTSCFWGLVPSADYEELAEKWISDEAHAELKKDTDLYYQAQLHSDANILNLVNSGVKVFDIVDYNYQLYTIIPSWDEYNADGIIHVDSTSMGAYSIGCSEPLGEDYVQANTDCGHNHISPDGCVDASTGLLPEHTFYFCGQDHEGTGRNDVIMKLAVDLLLSDRIQDVHSCPDEYPQFNFGRETKHLRGMLTNAKGVDQSTLSAEDAAALQAAIVRCDNMLAETVVDVDECTESEAQLEAIMVKLGLCESNAKTPAEKILTAICKKASDELYDKFGPRGFSDSRAAINQ